MLLLLENTENDLNGVNERQADDGCTIHLVEITGRRDDRPQLPLGNRETRLAGVAVIERPAASSAVRGKSWILFMWCTAIQNTVGLNNFRIGNDGVQGNQVQGITRRGLEVLNLNF